MGATQVRIAGLLSNIPESVPVSTVNRQCSSGLQAIANVAANIGIGFYDIGLAGGVESMSFGRRTTNHWEGQINEEALEHDIAKGCYLSMGLTSENVSEKFNISREKQDYYSEKSHQRAYKAQIENKFNDEIVPVKVIDKKTNEEKIISLDEGIRSSTTKEILSKLKPAFKKDGSTTAGNSSQVSDGAAVCLVMSRATAFKLNLPITAKIRSFAVEGCLPEIMGIGPALAIPSAVKKANLSLKDIDLFEINEAFASQFVYCIEKLKLDYEKVNVNGGAIALGHPLGCTGARLVATITSELKKRNEKLGVVSMCCGSGMGVAMVLEME